MEHVLSLEVGDVTATVRLADDLTVVDVQTSAPFSTADARELLQTGAVPGRSRVGRLQALNCNTFPPVPLPGLRVPAYTGEFRPEEDVTVALAEGPGAAVSLCNPLDAVTCWWLDSAEHAEPSAEEVTFTFDDGTYQTTSAMMRSFISATAPDLASPVIHVAAIPRAVLPAASTMLRVNRPGDSGDSNC